MPKNIEAELRPLSKDIGRPRSFVSPDIDIEECEVVGLATDVDINGYARHIFTTDDPPYIINNATDVINWFSKEDRRAFFTAYSHWADPLFKWFGDKILDELDELSVGNNMHLEGGRLKLLPGGFTTSYSGRKWSKKIRCLESLYHMSDLLAVEEDCFSIKTKALRLIQTLHKYRMPQGNLRSAGGILQSYILGAGVRFCSTNRTPLEAVDMFTNCYHTNWITAVRLGKVEKAFDYDISSAYPSQTSTLQSCDPTCGRWKHSPNYHPSASYGGCKVHVWLDPNNVITPMMFRGLCNWDGYRADSRQSNCVGEWDGWLTKVEIDFINKYKIGKVKILDGWWFLADSEYRPFSDPMNRFFSDRQKAKDVGDSFAGNLFKLISVAGQGKFKSYFPTFGQLSTGPMWNPIYAAQIVSSTRVQVGEFLLENDAMDNLLHIAVDGVCLDKKVNAPGGVGQFRLESPETGVECIVAKDGQYWMPGRKSIFKKKVLEDNYNEDSYPNMVYQGRYSLLEAAANHIEFEKVGTPRPVKSTQLGSKSRMFEALPEKCSDLLSGEQYYSIPFVMR